MIIIWVVLAAVITSFGLIVLRGAPYVPSHKKQLQKAFDELYDLSKKDTLVDLGSGDGVVLEAAAVRGARAIGYELNPFLVLISRVRLKKYDRVMIKNKDFLSLDKLPSNTTLVYAFTTGHSIEQIGQKLESWSQGKTIYFISYGFELKKRRPLRSIGPMHLYEFKG